MTDEREPRERSLCRAAFAAPRQGQARKSAQERPDNPNSPTNESIGIRRLDPKRERERRQREGEGEGESVCQRERERENSGRPRERGRFRDFPLGSVVNGADSRWRSTACIGQKTN